MPDRDRVASDKRGAVGAQQRSGDDIAERIRTVEDQHGDAVLAQRLEHVRDRPEIGVKARADVLKIADDDVQIGEHGAGRAEMFAVQAVNGQPGAGIHHRGDAFGIRRGGKDAVFGREQRREPNVRLAAQNLDGAGQGAVDGAGIGQQPDAQSAQRLELIAAQHFNSGADVAHRRHATDRARAPQPRRGRDILACRRRYGSGATSSAANAIRWLSSDSRAVVTLSSGTPLTALRNERTMP